jgi:hypothetical protein
MPLYTPLGGSWLDTAESVQRIVVRRALAGQAPETPQQIVDALEATAKGWNLVPTPFVWGGKRAARRNLAISLMRLAGETNLAACRRCAAQPCAALAFTRMPGDS